MTADQLARAIIVRHRAAGYLRLELPAAICHAAAGEAMGAALCAVAGVHRVAFQAAERRLVIAYDPHACKAADVARALRASLSTLPGASAAESPPPASTSSGDLPPRARPNLLRQARHGFAELRQRLESLRHAQAPAGSLQARLQPMVANALTEKAIINFLNDLLAFYLVKVHWELISQRWLKQPVRHADAWLAVFYLMFLLVRYRKSIAAKAVPVEPATP